MNKPITPYARLLTDVRAFADKVMHPHRKTMWVYSLSDLAKPWHLHLLLERVRAADQLGYDVRLSSIDSGLHVEYVKRVDVPWEWK